ALALRGPPPDAAGGGRVARSGASRARAAPGHAVGLAYRAQAPLSRWPSHGNGDPVPVRARHQAPDVRPFTLERAPRVPIWDHVRPPAIFPETPLAPIDENTARVLLPDVANDARPVHAGALDWVGMGDIEVPVLLAGEDGVPVRTPARVSAYVNLTDPSVRGIHMSRLYLQLDRHLPAELLTPCSVRRLLRDFLDSHQGLSDRAFVRIAFDHMLRRRALKSDNSGWRAYPVTITGRMEGGQLALELAVDVAYSSTCPCSAALARQLVQQR